jgi:hypothetical protein
MTAYGDIAQEFRAIEIDLFLTPYMPIGNGDRDQRGIVCGSGTFTDERYGINCLMIFGIVKSK